jgi:hypothetical protein
MQVNRRRTSPLYAFFMLGIMLLTLVIAEQGRTIENQQLLIKVLSQDSTDLATLRVQQITERHQQK